LLRRPTTTAFRAGQHCNRRHARSLSCYLTSSLLTPSIHQQGGSHRMRTPLRPPSCSGIVTIVPPISGDSKVDRCQPILTHADYKSGCAKSSEPRGPITLCWRCAASIVQSMRALNNGSKV
jgi:hypothetical protein